MSIVGECCSGSKPSCLDKLSKKAFGMYFKLVHIINDSNLNDSFAHLVTYIRLFSFRG